MRIGIAGFGRMGAAMGARIVAQGHQLSVWNRSPGPLAVAEALGARLARTPSELADDCDILLSSLFDEHAVRAVYFGPNGILGGKVKDRLLIDTSTVPPALGPELAQAAVARGWRFVDAPVLGTVGPARSGALIALVGGNHEDIARATSMLAIISRAVHPLGPSGAGYAGKLAITLLKATYWAALGDCLGLARRFHIEPAAILDVIETGPGAIVELPLKMPVLRGQPTEPAFDIGGCLKDLRSMVAAGGGVDQVPVAAGALRAVERAVAGGWADRDVAAVALFSAAEIARRQTDKSGRELRAAELECLKKR